MRTAALLLLAFLPTAYFAWTSQGIPHLGHFHDDAVYVGTAASLAEGRGYRVESLPGEPYQLRYPPLFPLYLAMSGGNRVAMTWLLAAVLAGLLFVLWQWRRDAWLVALTGWNVYAVLFAGSALSELFGTFWMASAVVFFERDAVRRGALCASAAYLARTALIVVPAGAVLWLCYRRRWRDAGIVAAIFAPVFLAWTLFVAAHADPNVSGTLSFYVSYTRNYAQNVDLALLPQLLWINFQALIAGAAGLLFFNTGDSFFEVNFARLLLFASVAGLWRQRSLRPWTMMAILYAILLTVWNYVPQERFLFPLLPLLLDGLLTELRFLGSALRASRARQPGAAVLVGGLIAAGLLWAAWRMVESAWRVPIAVAEQYRPLLPEREQAHAWIRANTPADAAFLAAEDPQLRRGTGRHGIGFHFPTRYYYENNTAAIVDYHMRAAERMRAEGLQYLLIGPKDLEQDLIPADRERIVRHWKQDAELETVYENPLYVVRRLRPLQSKL